MSIRFVALLVMLCVAVHGDLSYPTYKQCDPSWASVKMGDPSQPKMQKTICESGSILTTIAMSLAGLGVQISGKDVDPASLNTWLQANSMYKCDKTDCTIVDMYAPETLSPRMSFIGSLSPLPSFGDIAGGIQNETTVTIAMANRTHTVLLTGVAAGQKAFTVNDPAAGSAKSVDYSDIAGVFAFKINNYPVFKQCDPTWGNVVMGQNGDTICQVGCLMSSISMGLSGTGIHVDAKDATPLTVNSYLQSHSGYAPGTSDLIESVITTIDPKRVQWPSTGMHTTNDIPFADIARMIDRKVPLIVIANVRDGTHFVLIVGYRNDGQTLVVNDPGFPGNTYLYDTVVGWRVFDME